MNKTNILALTGSAGSRRAAPRARADDDGFTPDTTHVVIDLGGHQGGDNLVNTTLINNGETKSVDAGDGIFGDIGLQHNFADSDFGWKLTYGLDTTKTSGNTGDIRFRDNPVDLLALYSIGENHIGFGVTEHLSPRLDLDGLGPNANFDAATGAILQYQYWLFGVRYTSIRYKVSSDCSSGCTLTATTWACSSTTYSESAATEPPSPSRGDGFFMPTHRPMPSTARRATEPMNSQSITPCRSGL